jgi:hypothetical protein
MNIRPIAADLFHAERWTDTTKLGIAFRNFVNEPKNQQHGVIMEILKCNLRNLVILYSKAKEMYAQVGLPVLR